MDKETQFVTVHGEPIFLEEDGVLDLHRKRITDMDQIEGLANIVGLKALYLGNSRENNRLNDGINEMFNTYKHL